MSSKATIKRRKKIFELMPSGIDNDRNPYFKPGNLQKNENDSISLLHLPIKGDVPLILEPYDNVSDKDNACTGNPVPACVLENKEDKRAHRCKCASVDIKGNPT